MIIIDVERLRQMCCQPRKDPIVGLVRAHASMPHNTMSSITKDKTPSTQFKLPFCVHRNVCGCVCEHHPTFPRTNDGSRKRQEHIGSSGLRSPFRRDPRTTTH